jgi:glycerol-3-phosphate dehydrogenase
MAKMAVDRLVERDGRHAPCRTDKVPLGRTIGVRDLQRVDGVPEAAYERLAGRYGAAAQRVLGVAAERSELAVPIVDGLPDLLAEVAFAARHEQATSIADVLLRRTRLGLLAAREVSDSRTLERVAATLATELGWNTARRSDAIEHFRAEAFAEGIAP